MQLRADDLVDLVARIHRRMLLMRVIEGAGLGVLMASAAAIVLLMVLIGRGQPIPVASVGLLPVGAICGVLWGVVRRPRAIEAALEADRQLGLADLLSTAWTLCQERRGSATERQPAADGFAAAVVAMGNARSAELSASSVTVNRLGVRVWGGIGLATALMMTLELLATHRLDMPASSAGPFPLVRVVTSEAVRMEQAAAVAPRLSRSVVRPIVPDYPNPDENGFNSARNSTAVEGSITAQSSSSANTANPEGAGSGIGTSRTKHADNSLAAEGTTATDAGGKGLSSAGTGSAGAKSGAEEGPSGGVVGSTAAQRLVPVWKSDSWPAAQDAVKAAVHAGQIPQQYQDLIRAYFDR